MLISAAGSSQPAYWSNLGPGSINEAAYSGGISPSTGRVSSLLLNGTGTIYLGAAGGGVWSSSNVGASWQPLTDRQPSLAMGALAMDPNNPKTIYAGTGEFHYSSDSFYGVGVLKSTDGGVTWTVLGANTFNGTYISAVVVAKAPTDGSVIYVASRRGLYKSTDGGQNWSLQVSGNIDSLVADPSNPSTLYASVRTSGIYRTTDGSSWTLLTGLPTGSSFGVTALAVAPSQPGTVYASVATDGDGKLTGIYKSADAGATWTQLTAAPDVFSQFFFYGWGSGYQGWYDNTIAVSPLDPNIVVVGGIGLMKTIDGGATWSTDLANPNKVHPDQHALVFDAQGNLFIGNDGGVWEMKADGTFVNLNHNLSITQYYPGISQYNNGALIIGGAQDNGTSASNGTTAWSGIYGGDGGYTAIDPNNSSIIYTESQNGNLVKSVNGGGSWTSLAVPKTSSNWVAPFVLVPDTPAANTLYFGGDNVYKSTDGGTTWTSTTQNTTSDKVSALAVAPSNHQVVYAGWNSGRVQLSKDGGATWQDISPVNSTWVTSITPSPTNPFEIYLTYSYYFPQYRTGAPHVLYTAAADNGLVAWTDITGNLPNAPVNALAIDGNSLIVASDVGVFTTTDRQTWTAVGQGLPNVQVVDLKITGDRKLLAATHGRGIWSLTLGSAPLAPTQVTAVSPNSGYGGTTVTITGSGFTAATAVTFGAYNALRFTVNSDTRITAVAPYAGGVMDVQVTGQGGVSAITAADRFTYLAGAAITNVTPSSGPNGATFTITGSGFGTSTGSVRLQVADGYYYAGVISWSDTSIQATVPSSVPLGTYQLWVRNSYGGDSNTVPFTVTLPVSLQSATPALGTIGKAITLIGSGFGNTTGTVVFVQNALGFAAQVTGWSDTSVTATVPAGLNAGNASIQVQPAAGGASAGLPFTVVGAPAAVSLTPAAATVVANGQSQLALSGKVTDANGLGVEGVVLDLAASTGTLSAASVTTLADGSFQVSWGPAATAGSHITVTATIRGSSPAISGSAAFDTVAPGAPATVTVIPADTSMAAGTSLAITGKVTDAANNAVPNTTVTLTATSGTIAPASVTTAVDGTYSATFTAPATAGAVTIMATADTVSGTAKVSVAGGAATSLTLTADFWGAAPGGAVVLSGKLLDANGNGVPNERVTVFASAGSVLTTYATTGSDGSYFPVILTPFTTGSVTVTTSVAGTTIATNLSIPVVNPATVQLSLPAQVTPGSTAYLRATVQDSAQHSLAGAGVTLTASAGSVQTRGTPVTGSAGATGPVTYVAPTTAGPVTVTAQVSSSVTATGTLTVVAGTPAGITLVPSSTSAFAGNSISVSGVVTDQYGNPVPGATVNLSAPSGAFDQTSVTTGSDGAYTVNFTPTAVGSVTLTATVAGSSPAVTGTASVSVQAGAPAGVTLVAAGSATAGIAATVTGQVTDTAGNPLAGVAVDLSAPSGSFDHASVTTANDGTYAANFTPTTPGNVTLTATVAGTNPAITATAAVNVQVGAPARVTLMGASSATAGVALQVSGRVTDAVGNPIPNAPVSLTAPSGTFDTASVTTGNDGTYTANFTSTAAGTVTLTATVTGTAPAVIGTLTVNVQSAAPTAVTLTAPASATAGAPSLVSGRVTDQYGNLIGAATVSLTAPSGSFDHASVVTANDGSYSATFTQNTPGNVTLTATVVGSNPAVTATAAVNVQVGAPARVTLTGTSSSSDAGVAVKVSGLVTDAVGNPISGAAVSLSAPAGTFDSASVTTGNDGTYAANFTSTVAGNVTLTATVTGTNPAVTGTLALAVRPGAPTAVTLTAPATAPAGAAAQVSGRVTDQYGNPIAAATVNLSAASGSFDHASAATANDGTYVANYTPTVLGAVTLTATIAGTDPAITATADVNVLVGAPASVTLIAPATATSGDTVQVSGLMTDVLGNPIAGATVNLRASSGTFDHASVTTGNDGAYTANFTATTAGDMTLSATAAGTNPAVTGTATITVQAGPAAGITLSVPSSLTTGSTGTVSVTVKDAANNPVAGAVVSLTVSNGSLSQPSVTTAANGTASVTFTAPTTAAPVTVTAQVDGTEITRTATITVSAPYFGGGGGGGGFVLTPTPADITVKADTDTVTAGEVATLSGTVKDNSGKPLSGVKVALTASAGTLDAKSVTTGTDGSFSAKLTAPADPGKIAVNAEAGSVKATATITVLAKPARIQLSEIEDKLLPGQTIKVGGTVTDAKGRPAAGIKVTLTASAGSLVPTSVTTGADGGFNAVFTAPEQGCSANITATAGGITADMDIKVEQVNTPEELTDNTVKMPVDTRNGSVVIATGDRSVQLTLPKGSLPAVTDVEVSATSPQKAPAAPAGLQLASRIWDIDSDKTQPSQPVVIQLRVFLPAGANPETLGLYTIVNEQWQFVTRGTYDPVTHMFTAVLPHFSEWAVMATVSFSDLPDTHWAYPAVTKLSQRGIVSGFPDSTFRPDTEVTRAQFIKMLLASLGVQPKVAATPVFTDVPAGAWYEGYMDEAARIGLLKGSDGKANPETPITRQEAAVILVRAMFYAHLASDPGAQPVQLPSFADQDQIAAWAQESTGQAALWGIMKGYPDGTFQPARSLSRAETSALMARILQRVDNPNNIPQ